MADFHIGPAQPLTAQPPEALGAEDFAALHALQMSDDPAQQAQAAALAKKLTPAETSAFGAFQSSQHPRGERGRVDNQVLGLPPEMAAISAAKIMQAVGTAGASAATRAVAAALTGGREITPLVKFEIARTALHSLGLPDWAATGGAMLLTGVSRGGKSVAADTAAARAPAAATKAAKMAEVPVTPEMEAMADRMAGGASKPTPGNGTFTPTAPPAPATSGARMEDAFRAFKARGETPGPAELNNAASMMRFGKTADQAVKRVIELRPTPTGADAVLALSRKPGVMTDAEVAAEIAARVRNRSPSRP